MPEFSGLLSSLLLCFLSLGTPGSSSSQHPCLSSSSAKQPGFFLELSMALCEFVLDEILAKGRNSPACCIRISNFSFYSRFYFLGVINIFDHLTSCNMKHAHTCTCISHGYLLIPTEFTRSHDALAKKLASMRILLLHLNHAFHLFFTVTCQRQWHTRRYPDTYTKSNHNMPLLSPSPPSNQGAHEDDIDRFNCSLMVMVETSIFMAPTRKLYFV